MLRRPSLQVLSLTALCNVVGSVLAVAYTLMVSADPGSGMPPPSQVLRWVAWASPVSFGMAALSGLRVFAHLDGVVTGLRGGQAVAEGERVEARRRALEMPVRMVRISSYSWLLVAAAYPFYARAFHLAVTVPGMAHAMLVMVGVGALSGVFIYYLAEWYLRRSLVPVLFPDGRLSAAAAAPGVTLGFKILILLLSTVLLPVAVLTIVALLGTLTARVVLFLGATFFASGVLQASFIARSVLAPVEGLEAAVARVGRNDLTAQAPVLSTDALGRLAEGFNAMVVSLRRAAFVRETFGRYVPEPVLEEILSGRVALGGEVRTVTVLFSDIRGFTALSESLAPAQVVQILNSYLDAMVEVVVAHGGTIDKFMGDAVMATFGVPLTRSDDPLRAVRAAVGMLERLAAWNAERAVTGQPALQIGVGVHTGVVVAGNIGSTKKMEYTVIGDVVNTASRIENLNKQLGTHLLISETTHALVAPAVVARRLDPVQVKGKSQPLVVYEVSGLTGAPGG